MSIFSSKNCRNCGATIFDTLATTCPSCGESDRNLANFKAMSEEIESLKAKLAQASTPQPQTVYKAVGIFQRNCENPTDARVKWISTPPKDGAYIYTECALIAPLSAVDSVAVQEPEGWKLVPIVPTTQMNAAGYMRNLELGSGKRNPEETYKAMLAAAPTLDKEAKK